MKKLTLVAILFLASAVSALACPCPTVGTIGSNSVIIRDFAVISAIDFTGAGEPVAPVALSVYLATTTVTKVSPAATFLAGHLYRHNAGNWELFLFAPGSTAVVGGTPYTFTNPWQPTSEVTNISQYVDPMGTAARLTAVPGIAAFTSTPLTAGATWSSGWIDLSGYQSVMQSYSANMAGTLVFDYSNDGVTPLAGQSSNLIYPPAGISLNSAVVNHFPTTKAKYFRIIYTNGIVPQASFNVMIRLSLDASVSAQTLSAVLFDSAVAQVNKSVIASPDSGGAYGKVQRTGDSLNVHVTNSSGAGSDVNVLNFPVTQPVSGTVTSNIGTGNLAGITTTVVVKADTAGNQANALKVDGSAVTQPISGSVSISGTPSVSVSNFPATQPVTDNGGSLTVDGAVSVSNFPSSQAVTGTFWQATQPVSGSVTATISGTPNVSVTNTPAVTISEGAKTAVQKTGTLSTTAVTVDQVVLTYTVTAGKTFYLQSLSMQGSLTAISAVASIMGVISLERPSGTKVAGFRAVNSTVSIPPLFVSEQAIPIPAGTVIRVVVTPAVATPITWIANFGGYEQ